MHAGHSAIVDAVYARPADRDLIEQMAGSASVPFVGLWLDAPEPVLISRSQRRRGDPSDANADVIRLQLAQDPGTIHWHRLDVSSPAGVVLHHAAITVQNHLRTSGTTAQTP